MNKWWLNWHKCAPLVALVMSLLPAPQVWAENEFLDPEQAFRLSARPLVGQRIEVRFDIAPGYYLYREKLSAVALPDTIKLGELQIPKGKIKFDITFEKDVEYFRESVTMVIPVQDAGQNVFKLAVGNQGCADKGLCYPPTQRSIKVEPGMGADGWANVSLLSESEAASGNWQSLGRATSVPPYTAAPAAGFGDPAPSTSELGRFARVLQSHSVLTIASVYFLAGLLLSFTPCVLPLIPILSSIIVGQFGAPAKARGFTLALAYSFGMAMVYTAFGMAAGLAGEGLAASLQNAWVLGGFALLLTVLSLSMFGVYELQMPHGLQNRLTRLSGSLKGGQHLGVFFMGGLSALIVSPCVAAPLAGALVYIGQTQNMVLGGAALFSLALGMSIPLLLVGFSAGSLLPRVGAWMQQVKHFFGLLLLAMALWMVSPVIPAWLLMLLTAALLLVSAVLMGAFEWRAKALSQGRVVVKGLGLTMALVAVLQMVGVFSGGRDVLQPLAHLGVGISGSSGSRTELKFQPVASVEELVAAVRASSRPVMVDFYADWCVACKELETLTFTNDAVSQVLNGMTLLRVDVTANSEKDRELMRKYNLFGPPALLFFLPAGEEIINERVIGFQSPEQFRPHLARVMALASAQAR